MTPAPGDLEVQSIPTEVEMVTKGNYDDIVQSRNQQQYVDDSKILSSILHQDSSNFQS